MPLHCAGIEDFLQGAAIFFRKVRGGIDLDLQFRDPMFLTFQLGIILI